MNADIGKFISEYHPRRVDEKHWERVSPFVKEVATLATWHHKDRQSISVLMGIVTRISIYVHVKMNQPLTPEYVFDHDNIEYWVNQELNVTTRVRGSQRSTLIKLGREFNTNWGGGDGNPTYGYKPNEEPYGEDELRQIGHWVDGLKTRYQRENAHSLIMLTLGAGLRPGEIAVLRTKDLIIDDFGAVVYPYGFRGAGPRAVPILDAFYQDAVAVKTNYEPEDYVFLPGRKSGSVDMIHSFLARAGRLHGMDLSLQRLRSNWIVHHMLRMVPEASICKAAGLADLQHYKQHRPDVDPMELRHLFHDYKDRNYPRLKVVS